MSAPKDGDRRPVSETDTEGVLSNLPRTRPQRASPRRAAARRARAAAGASTALPTDANGKSSPARPKDTAARPATGPRANGASSGRRARGTTAAGASGRIPRKRTAQEPVPRQGFECEGERANGPVQPPGGIELVASAAELVGELAKAGVSTGERVLKDVLSRLPLS
jgi:hypothetical protein